MLFSQHVEAVTLSSRHGTMSVGPMELRGALLLSPDKVMGAAITGVVAVMAGCS